MAASDLFSFLLTFKIYLFLLLDQSKKTHLIRVLIYIVFKEAAVLRCSL